MFVLLDNIVFLELALICPLPLLAPSPLDVLARKLVIVSLTIVEVMDCATLLVSWPTISVWKMLNAILKIAPKEHVLVFQREDLALLTQMLTLLLVIMAFTVHSLDPPLELVLPDLSLTIFAIPLLHVSHTALLAFSAHVLIGMMEIMTLMITAPSKPIAINPPFASMDIAKQSLMEIVVQECVVKIKFVPAMVPQEPIARMLMTWIYAKLNSMITLFA